MSEIKKYNIIVMGSYNPVLSAIVASFKEIHVKYYIKDESVRDDGAFERFWEEYGAEKAELTEDCLNKVDIVFVLGYTKIIKSDLLEKYVFVNIHAGNLPKWRGTSANSWAIVNGDYNIAYTLHRVTDVLDGGPIFSKFEYHLQDGEKYGDGRKKLENILSSELEAALVDICSGKNAGTEQSGRYAYCCSFRKSDGVISDWNVETQRLLDLFRVFGQPYGSGMFLCYKQKQYELMDISKDDDFETFYCVPGAVVYKNSFYIWIKTKDSVVKIKDVKNEDGDIVSASKVFRIGVRLG